MDFVKFIGPFIAGKGVAVYRDCDAFVVKAETSGFDPVKYTTDVDGEKVWRTTETLTLTESGFDDLMAELTQGANHNSAITTQRALIKLGYPAEAFE